MRKSTCSTVGCTEPIASPSNRYCKVHSAEQARAWQQANPNKVREASLRWHKAHPVASKVSQRRTNFKRLYNTTPEEVAAKLEAQGGVCAICGTSEPKGKGWCVDHDHKTSILRGVLCSPCNVGLGMFQDNPDLLVVAVSYLTDSP